MREGWEYKKFGEVCDILNGFAFKSKLYVQEGIRVIRISNVQKGCVEDKDPKFYPCEAYNEIKKYMLQPNDLLMSLTGNVGRVGLLKEEMLPAALNQRVACIRIKSKKLLQKFLFLYLNSDVFENLCVKSAKGVAQPNMSTVWLANQYIPIPSMDEQHRIVSFLDSEFSKIDTLKANAECALQNAKDLFQATLKEVMTPKEGWVFRKLGEVCDFEGGAQPPKSEWVKTQQEGYVRMLQIRDFTQSRKAEIEYVKQTKKLRLCKADDILIGRYGASVGKILTGLEGAYNVAIIKSIPDERIVSKTFIRRYFESPIFQNILLKICSQRAAQAGFSKDDIWDAPILLPPLDEQLRIVSFLDSEFSKTDTLKVNTERIIQECQNLKQSLLKQVFE